MPVELNLTVDSIAFYNLVDLSAITAIFQLSCALITCASLIIFRYKVPIFCSLLCLCIALTRVFNNGN